MKLFCKDEMQRLEQAAVEAGVPLSLLMENAGAAVAQEAEKLCRPIKGRRVVLLCGKGNNGGDGFVCARKLTEAGAECTVLLVQGEPQTGLSRAAFDAMSGEVECVSTQSQPEKARQALDGAELVVDAVFGFSFRGQLSGDAALFISLANAKDCPRISADLPSGAECDTGRVCPGAFRADVTVTFTGKKPANCSYPAKEYCGKTVMRQVGVPAALTEGAQTRCFELGAEHPGAWLNKPDLQCNKGSQGRLLLVCGSYGMAGACIMAARAALRCGVGLLHIAIDRRIYPIVAQAVPEAVFTVLDMEHYGEETEQELLSALGRCSACLVGCGLGQWAQTLCPLVLSHCESVLVVDADALNYVSRHPGTLEGVRAPMILTPHPGEMARLCADSISEIQADRLGAARVKAREAGGVVVLKGAATVIAAPDGRCAINPTGNPGMAKGGSGDVLAGITASLAAQGIPPFQAGALGAYLHGLAGDLCREEYSWRAMLPTDLIDMLPRVFRRFTPEG